MEIKWGVMMWDPRHLKGFRWWHIVRVVPFIYKWQYGKRGRGWNIFFLGFHTGLKIGFPERISP